jgi:hypothetical protein
MANILIAYPNRTDQGTLSGGSWQPTLPLDNLKTRVYLQVARTTNAALASTKFDVDLGKTRMVGVMALVAHNLSVLAKVRLTGSEDPAFATTTVTSGWVSVWPAGMIPDDQLEWTDDYFWLGVISDEERAAYNTPFSISITPTPSRYWRIEIDDTANTAGYVQIGRLFLGDGWQPEYNYDYGAGESFVDDSPVEQAQGGTEYFDTRGKRRQHSYTLSNMPKAEAYARALEMQRLVGTSSELLLIPDPEDAINGPRRNMVCRLQRLSPITHTNFDRYQCQLVLQELL